MEEVRKPIYGGEREMVVERYLVKFPAKIVRKEGRVFYELPCGACMEETEESNLALCEDVIRAGSLVLNPDIPSTVNDCEERIVA